jgi:hypothetical protein
MKKGKRGRIFPRVAEKIMGGHIHHLFKKTRKWGL